MHLTMKEKMKEAFRRERVGKPRLFLEGLFLGEPKGDPMVEYIPGDEKVEACRMLLLNTLVNGAAPVDRVIAAAKRDFDLCRRDVVAAARYWNVTEETIDGVPHWCKPAVLVPIWKSRPNARSRSRRRQRRVNKLTPTEQWMRDHPEDTPCPAKGGAWPPEHGGSSVACNNAPMKGRRSSRIAPSMCCRRESYALGHRCLWRSLTGDNKPYVLMPEIASSMPRLLAFYQCATGYIEG
jgi:hypothetical protein